MNKNKMEILGGTLVGMMFLSGCAPATETNKTQAAESAPTPGNNAESPYVKYTPTVEAASLPMPTRPDMAGGPYNSDQQYLIEVGVFKETEDALTSWFDYWANATNNPFHPETTDLHFKYVFSADNNNSGVCLESSAYPGVCFALPIINGEVAEVPPTVSGEYTIPVGFGPLEMSDQLTVDQVSVLKLDTSLADSVLGYENGGWVRIKDGKVVGNLDLKIASWLTVEVNNKEIDQNITEFLQGNDKFSDDNLEKIVMGEKDYSANKIKGDLGILTESDSRYVFQGIILGSVVKDNDVVAFVGTKNFEGKRVVLPVYRDQRTLNFGASGGEQFMNSRVLDWNSSKDYDSTLNKSITDINVWKNDFNSRVGEPVAFSVITVDDIGIDSFKNSILKNGGTQADVDLVVSLLSGYTKVAKNLGLYLNKAYFDGQKGYNHPSNDSSKDLMILISVENLDTSVLVDRSMVLTTVVFIKK